MASKIDSNFTGLRYAEESSIKVLPTNPTWYPLEPNSYKDFGGQVTLLARDVINPSRQRKKGVITDLDASGGFTQDLTQSNLVRLLQGFFFANIREKVTNLPMNAAAVPITGIDGTTKTYTLSGGVIGNGFAAGDLLFASGFNVPSNNGLKTVASSTAVTVVVTEALTTEAATPATAEIQKVGVALAAGVAKIDITTGAPRLAKATGTVNFLSMGLIAGEWVFIGGDTTTSRFDNANNNGFARIKTVAADYIEFDKTSGTFAAEAGAGKSIQLFFGNVLKNEDDPTKIVQKSYQIERTLGRDNNGVMSEYLIGAVPNELSLEVKQADKITADMTFVAVDNEQRTGAQGVKAGSRPALVESAAFNTSSDFSRIKLHVITAGQTNPSPLFAFLSELSLSIKNNVSPNKAVGVLGAFDVSAGTFEVSASITAYFADVTAVQAVRNNTDVALDFAIVKNNTGFVFDLPLVSLGDGRLSVEKDKPITLPLSADAAMGANGHTLLLNEFSYLPNLADM